MQRIDPAKCIIETSNRHHIQGASEKCCVFSICVVCIAREIKITNVTDTLTHRSIANAELFKEEETTALMGGEFFLFSTKALFSNSVQ